MIGEEDRNLEEISLRIYLGSDLTSHRTGHGAASTNYNIQLLIQQFVTDNLSGIQVNIFQESVPPSFLPDSMDSIFVEKKTFGDGRGRDSPRHYC